MTAWKPGIPLFTPASEAMFFETLNQKLPAGSTVLSAYQTGNTLPAWAPMRVVIGHGPESAGLKELEPRVETFFDAAEPDAARFQLIDELNINYVLWGPEEKKLGNWDPHSALYLKSLLRQNEYEIFEVIPGMSD